MKTKLRTLVGTSLVILVVVVVVLAFTNKGIKETFMETEILTLSSKVNATNRSKVDVTISWSGDYVQTFLDWRGPQVGTAPLIPRGVKSYTITNLQPGNYQIYVNAFQHMKPTPIVVSMTAVQTITPTIHTYKHPQGHIILPNKTSTQTPTSPKTTTTTTTTTPTPSPTTTGAPQASQPQSVQYASWTRDSSATKLKQVSHSGNNVCGVNDANQVMCKLGTTGTWKTLPGILKHISVDGNRACGVNPGNEIFCANNLQQPSWQKLPGLLKQIDIDGNTMCGVNASDEVFCFKNGKWDKKGGLVSHISVSNGRACGVNPGNEIFCADDTNTMSWQKVDGLLKQIDLAGDRMCGVNAGGDLFCAKYKTSAWKKNAPFKAQNVSIDKNNSAFTVDDNKNMFYTSTTI